jgi:thioesterase domain-containing protein
MSKLIDTNIPYLPTSNSNGESEYAKFKTSKSKASRKGRKWSEDEDADLIKELKNHTIEQVAELHGRTAKAIQMHLQEIAGRMKEQKIDSEEIKQQLNLKDEDLVAAEKRAKAREDNNSVNLAENLDQLKNKIDGLEALVLKQSVEMSELKAMLQQLLRK